MSYIFIHSSICIGNRSLINTGRKFVKFPPFTITIKSTFCSQIKDKLRTEVNDKCDDHDTDIDTLKNEMFEDFETEKEKLQTNTFRMDKEEADKHNIDESESESEYNVFEDKDDKLSFAVQQFKKRMEFNKSLKNVAKIKSIRGVSYKSASINAGIPELIYDAEGTDQWVTYLRLYTYTPFTIGCLFVPLSIYGFPDWELFPKLILAAFYMSTSAIFPLFSYRAVKDKVNRGWLAPDCEKLIIEKLDFFFQPYKKEYFIKDLRVLYKKGSDRTCWFQCNKTKTQFLLVSEMMQHSVWLQLLGVDHDQLADATLRNIANDGRVTMFRGPNLK